MHKQPEIAILTHNMLVGLGLKSIIEKIIPIVNIEIFQEFSDFVDADPTRFFHYFVSFNLFCEQKSFFIESKNKTILIINDALERQNDSMTTINMNQSEEVLVHCILKLHESSNHHPHSMGNRMSSPHSHINTATKRVLTSREGEVLRLIAKGYINREIADAMCISVTTVISHRKSIVSKLEIKSVAGLTIYAIANGYVNIDSL